MTALLILGTLAIGAGIIAERFLSRLHEFNGGLDFQDDVTLLWDPTLIG